MGRGVGGGGPPPLSVRDFWLVFPVAESDAAVLTPSPPSLPPSPSNTLRPHSLHRPRKLPALAPSIVAHSLIVLDASLLTPSFPCLNPRPHRSVHWSASGPLPPTSLPPRRRCWHTCLSPRPLPARLPFARLPLLSRFWHASLPPCLVHIVAASAPRGKQTVVV